MGPVDLLHQLVDLCGLDQEIEGPQPHAFHRGLHGGVPGEQDDLGVGPDLLNLPEGLHAAFSRHEHVHHRHIHVVVLEIGHGLLAAAGGGHLEVADLHAQGQSLHELPLVVHQQDLDFHEAHPCRKFELAEAIVISAVAGVKPGREAPVGRYPGGRIAMFFEESRNVARHRAVV